MIFNKLRITVSNEIFITLTLLIHKSVDKNFNYKEGLAKAICLIFSRIQYKKHIISIRAKTCFPKIWY